MRRRGCREVKSFGGGGERGRRTRFEEGARCASCMIPIRRV
jgi:hypothetical protein